MNSQYSIFEHSGVLILQVPNLLNEFENKKILEAANTRIEEGFSNFVVDLSGTEYMNSVGLNFLISMKKKSMQLEGQLILVNPSNKIVSLLEITKLRDKFNLKPTVEEALKALA